MSEWTCIVCGGEFEYIRRRENIARTNGFIVGFALGVTICLILFMTGGLRP